MATINFHPPKIGAVIVGVIISILIIYLGFGLIQRVFTRASDTLPRDVLVSDISDNSAKIVWSTDQESQAVIEYGTTPTALNFFAPEAAQAKDHAVDLTLLSPSTTYYFQVRIGDKKYDNGGVPWTFATKGSGASLSPTVKPTATPSPAISVRPTQSVRVGEDQTGTTVACGETDCVKICRKLGGGCEASDLSRNNCIGKINISDCSLTAATPTATPSATP